VAQKRGNINETKKKIIDKQKKGGKEEGSKLLKS